MDPLDDPWVVRLQNVRQTCDRRVLQVEKQMRGLVRKWHRNEDLAKCGPFLQKLHHVLRSERGGQQA